MVRRRPAIQDGVKVARKSFDDSRVVDAIDAKRRLEDSLHNGEVRALRIACGLEKPTKTYTMAWAREECLRACRELAEINYLVKIAKRAVEEPELDDLDVKAMAYVVEKPKQKTEVGLTGNMDIGGQMSDEERAALKEVSAMMARREIERQGTVVAGGNDES